MVNTLYITDSKADYLQDQILIGLKRFDQVECLDYPRKGIIYEDCSIPDSDLYGNGFTIWKTIDSDGKVNRSNIFKRLYAGEFDLLIFGSIHRQKEKFEKIDLNRVNCPIIFLDGEDERYSRRFRDLVPFFSELRNRYQRGMEVVPQFGAEIYEPSLNSGFYFKREKRDHLTRKNSLHRVSFSIPDEKILECRPVKEQTFQTQVQCSIAYELDEVAENCTKEPIFDSEASYYEDIAAAKYGVTMKKGGWECMRHYEIAANWTVPCFYNLLEKPAESAPHGLRDLENCIMFSTAKELERKIAYIEEHDLYRTIQQNTVAWVKANTCKKKAEHVLTTAGVQL
jgi:hypothetical protein